MTDTSITAQTIIDNSVARAMDTQDTQWTDPQLLGFLNKAYDYVQKLLIKEHSEIAITDATITLVADTQEYALSGNLDNFWAMAINGVYFDGVSDPLTPATHEDKIRAAGDTTDTYPELYYVTGTHLGVLDIPTSTAVAAHGTLNCRYFKGNTALALADSMPYKNILNEPMATFMDHLAMFKAEVPAQELTALYNALEQATLEIIRTRVPI